MHRCLGHGDKSGSVVDERPWGGPFLAARPTGDGGGRERGRGLVAGRWWTVGPSATSQAGAVVVVVAAFATYYLAFPIGWWLIRGTRLRRAGRALWRPRGAPCFTPLPADVALEERVQTLPRPPHGLVETMRARLQDWLPPGHRCDLLSDRLSVVLVYHGAERAAESPCGVFRLDGAIVGCVEFGVSGLRVVSPSGELLAAKSSWRRGDRSWRTYRRRRFSLVTTVDEVLAIGLLHRPSDWREGLIAMIVLSEVVTSSQRWAVIRDRCEALGLPVPFSGGD
jgi:hypothetical protein